jgi:hypothetical protein
MRLAAFDNSLTRSVVARADLVLALESGQNHAEAANAKVQERHRIAILASSVECLPDEDQAACRSSCGPKRVIA